MRAHHSTPCAFRRMAAVDAILALGLELISAQRSCATATALPLMLARHPGTDRGQSHRFGFPPSPESVDQIRGQPGEARSALGVGPGERDAAASAEIAALGRDPHHSMWSATNPNGTNDTAFVAAAPSVAR